MELQKVTIEDGKACASLIKALGAAKFDGLTGRDIDALALAKQWLHGLALQMAAQLKSTDVTGTPAPSQGFKVKSMGQISSPSKTKLRKNKK